MVVDYPYESPTTLILSVCKLRRLEVVDIRDAAHFDFLFVCLEYPPRQMAYRRMKGAPSIFLLAADMSLFPVSCFLLSWICCIFVFFPLVIHSIRHWNDDWRLCIVMVQVYCSCNAMRTEPYFNNRGIRQREVIKRKEKARIN
jgi:hypothetical protein